MSKYSAARSVNGHKPVPRTVYREGRQRSFYECAECEQTAESASQFELFACPASGGA